MSAEQPEWEKLRQTASSVVNRYADGDAWVCTQVDDDEWEHTPVYGNPGDQTCPEGHKQLNAGVVITTTTHLK